MHPLTIRTLLLPTATKDELFAEAGCFDTRDLHRHVAAFLLQVPYESVTDEDRGAVKHGMFEYLYGTRTKLNT